jgi:catechol 2,3-dioxygenase-like lactoylglutathione lyase family enzyme
MIAGGNVTVFVSDMDRAVAFYFNQLGLKLSQRFENHWAARSRPICCLVFQKHVDEYSFSRP